MPAFKEWNDLYHDAGLLIILNNDSDSLADAENYLINTIGFTATDHVQYIGDTSPFVWDSYGYGGYPTSILIDRDGNIRQQDLGAIDMNYPPDYRHDDWTNAIAELTGGS
jgi:hypothetical protein